ncbi:hypothetical protein CIPAW_06G166500 [Carya illinoinensis]|uniref:Uncharacterized protein n=1 Tax=Carya illinoinensis TaxID=32201 RepID=A0A8T1QCH2_CARIL|nr:hypothetical protein CIPAW_06G166500 [Carya illinoinensis]
MELCNFLRKGSLECQERQRRGCFLGRRQSPRSPGAPSQPRRHRQQTPNIKIMLRLATPTSTNLTPPHFPHYFFSLFVITLFLCFPLFFKHSYHQALLWPLKLQVANPTSTN